MFSLDPVSGAVVSTIARAGWASDGGYSPARILPAPFTGNDIVAITNSPVGYTAFIGLDNGTTSKSQEADVHIARDDFLRDAWIFNVNSESDAAPKLKSYGRMGLAFESLGEGVWVD